ncbi:MAG: hypothetical protein ABJH45_04135 [Paracoccaceae bacterium]
MPTKLMGGESGKNMSDLLTNSEVEDVLSSIRRLVSDEERDLAKKLSEGSEPSVERVILTPAQMITPANDANDTDNIENIADLDVIPDDDGATVFLLQDAMKTPISEDAVAVSTDDGVLILRNERVKHSPDGEATLPENFEFKADEEGRSQTSVSASETEDGLSSEEAKNTLSEGDAVNVADVGEDELCSDQRSNEVNDFKGGSESSKASLIQERPTNTDHSKHSLEDKVATLETLIASRGDQWEPDVTGQSDYAAKEYPVPSWNEDAFVGDETLHHEEASLTESVSTDALISEQPDDLARAVGDILTVKPPKEGTFVLEDKALVQPMNLDAWSVDDEAPFEYVASDDENQTSAQAAAIASSVVSGLHHTKSEEASTDEEAILDEETIREMIADIVREELQGALGNRITRNIRKLVRREIHRALAAQDLD